MDVSATGQAAAAAVPQANVAITDNVAAPAQNTADIAVTSAPASTQSADSHSGTNPGQNQSNHSALAPAIAKLFAGPAAPEPIRLDVSYRIERDPNVIVTVFTDPKTGQEVAQFPPEVLFNLAQFFDQPRGATLDRSA